MCCELGSEALGFLGAGSVNAFSPARFQCPNAPSVVIVLSGCHCSFLVLLAHHLISRLMVIVWDVHKFSHCTPVIPAHSPCHVLCGNMPCGTWNNQTLILTERITDMLFFYCLWGSFKSSEMTMWSLRKFQQKLLNARKSCIFHTECLSRHPSRELLDKRKFKAFK